jgi:endogenous inhibitor of DNA gyrase (YacG/DUF329 family)
MSCPICSKPVDAKYAPFCSKRCADIDLSRWLKGNYAIPGGPAGEEDETGPSGGGDSHENRDMRGADKGMDRE